ncbi:MAG: phenylalanine--tRNA ligase subunit beta [Planctomycetes bacterium]|nr:phenylalanine--tRNA ligase subunit beta [Planctomycetota bacterium]
MHVSVSLLNRLLTPPTLAADEAESLLTHSGFPIESRTALADGDEMLDVEVTSNRGDMLCASGCAREIAARSGRTLKMPAAASLAASGPAPTLENLVPGECPLFTLRIIRSVKVGPSPAWLVQALESVGQRSINNVVDATNFVAMELGNPSHVFDLNKLAGHKLIVRRANAGEMLTTLDGKPRKLSPDEVVVADAAKAQSLAGVMGGQESEVSAATSDVAVEVATWDPVAVRRAARRHQIRTEASHRFERVVRPETLAAASDRLCALIIELAGGKPDGPIATAGQPLPAPRVVSVRASRAASIIGYAVTTADIASLLTPLGFVCVPHADGSVACTVPAWRNDISREIDLIEEIARMKGLDAIPTHDAMQIRVRPPQGNQRAMRELGSILTGLGYYEALTFSFTSPARAKPFLSAGLSTVAVDDDRRKHEPTLRPSALTGLLTCRRANQDGGVLSARLFETSAVFAQRVEGKNTASVETRMLALLADCPIDGSSIERKQAGIRTIRGSIEAVVRALLGPEAAVTIKPVTNLPIGYDASASGEVHVTSAGTAHRIGQMGLLSQAVQNEYGLANPVAIAEVELQGLIANFPPLTKVRTLPTFPAIERDVSAIVDETVSWYKMSEVIRASRVALLEDVNFVYTYRGKQIGKGKKSVTARLRFRDPSRTLRHEEVDPQMASVTDLLKNTLKAEIRTT